MTGHNISKICFVYESNHPIEVKDGLCKALELLSKDFQIIKLNVLTSTNIPECDFVLGWGAFGSKVDRLVRKSPYKKGLCIGGVSNPDGMMNYDVLFYETKWFRDQIKFHPNIVHAFGVDTDTYFNQEIERDIDYLGVGALALWKRWDKFCNLKGYRRVIGEFQKGNPLESQNIMDKLETSGVIYKDMIPKEELALMYNRAKIVYIPATIHGGGERAILEARACGCDVKIENDNPKLEELLTSPIYDYNYYYQQLKKGIESC